MKTIVRALLLAAFLAVPAKAHAWGSSGGFQINFNAGCKNDGCGRGNREYTYWPYDAYFQVPASEPVPVLARAPADVVDEYHSRAAFTPPPGVYSPSVTISVAQLLVRPLIMSQSQESNPIQESDR